jgi:hypothetical protein
MSAEPATPLAVFGDPDGGHWAFLVGGEQPRLALSSVVAPDGGGAPAWRDVTLDHDDDAVWLVGGDGTDLKIEMAQATTSTDEGHSTLAPCRLTGTIAIDASTELDLPGVVLADLPDGKVDSTRMIGSWFAAGEELGLLSVRPKSAKGQDADQVEVVARGEDGTTVFDPRLSTTYGPSGHPRKTGVELWIGDDEDGEQHPRRVSGVASGSYLTHTVNGRQVHAYALHCLSRADAGTGVYVLIRPS